MDLPALACAIGTLWGRMQLSRHARRPRAAIHRAAAHDVINGQPLHYRRTDDGRFVLYSVGWMKRMTAGKSPHKPARWIRRRGDWVWQYPVP